jgi:hypothetical protein
MTEDPKTQIVKAEISVFPPPPMDLVVIARNPIEMENAQARLIGWAQGRLVVIAEEVLEAKENLTIATKAKYKTRPWKNALAKAEQRLLFYKKMKLALEAGYCIIPDFPITTIAVRTTKKKPSNETKNGGINSLDLVKAQELEAGEGQYVAPFPDGMEWKQDVKLKDGKGELYSSTQWFARAHAHDAVDFPFHMVKPTILKDTKAAMDLLLFDEIGVLPQVNQSKRTRDPIVVGRIVRRQGSSESAINFLITWWVDTRSL